MGKLYNEVKFTHPRMSNKFFCSSCKKDLALSFQGVYLSICDNFFIFFCQCGRETAVNSKLVLKCAGIE